MECRPPEPLLPAGSAVPPADGAPPLFIAVSSDDQAVGYQGSIDPQLVMASNLAETGHALPRIGRQDPTHCCRCPPAIAVVSNFVFVSDPVAGGPDQFAAGNTTRSDLAMSVSARGVRAYQHGATSSRPRVRVSARTRFIDLQGRANMERIDLLGGALAALATVILSRECLCLPRGLP
jgi:hypothetical protein